VAARTTVSRSRCSLLYKCSRRQSLQFRGVFKMSQCSRDDQKPFWPHKLYLFQRYMGIWRTDRLQDKVHICHSSCTISVACRLLQARWILPELLNSMVMAHSDGERCTIPSSCPHLTRLLQKELYRGPRGRQRREVAKLNT
jgi:hypothetical protein